LHPESLVSRNVIYSMRHASVGMGAAATSVRVSRDTLEELERFQRTLKTRTADETIRRLMHLKRKELADLAYGSLKGRVSAFTEADRLDSHY